MTKEDQDERFGNEEPTKPGGPPSIVGRVLGDFAIAYGTAFDDLRETAELIDRLPADQRGHRLRDLAWKLGQLGDAAHEARVIVLGLSQLA